MGVAGAAALVDQLASNRNVIKAWAPGYELDRHSAPRLQVLAQLHEAAGPPERCRMDASSCPSTWHFIRFSELARLCRWQQEASICRVLVAKLPVRAFARAFESKINDQCIKHMTVRAEQVVHNTHSAPIEVTKPLVACVPRQRVIG